MAGPDRLRVCVDGSEHSAAWAVATMGRRYAGSFVLAPQAHLEDASIHAVLFRAPSRLSMVTQLVEVAAGRVARRTDVEQVPGGTIEITSDEPVPVQLDGEPFGSTPVTIRTGGPILRLLTPKPSGTGARAYTAERKK